MVAFLVCTVWDNPLMTSILVFELNQPLSHTLLALSPQSLSVDVLIEHALLVPRESRTKRCVVQTRFIPLSHPYVPRIRDDPSLHAGRS